MTSSIKRASKGIPAWAWRLAGCVLVFDAVAAVYWPASRFEFVNWDDPYVVIDNPYIREFSWLNVDWMLRSLHITTFMPVTWLAYAAINTLAGRVDPHALHLACLLLHSLNAALLGLACASLLALSPATQRACDGPRLLASFLAAFLWAIHPQQVQAACWISALNDVLSSSLFLGALLCYFEGYDGQRVTLGWLSLCWLLFTLAGLTRWKALGLAVVLLILDLYPLRRLRPRDRGSWARPLLEKIPFGVVALGVAWRTALAKGLESPRSKLFIATPSEAAVRVLFYLRKFAWPAHLMADYTARGVNLGGWLLPASLPILALLLAGLLWIRRRLPGLVALAASYLLAIAPTVVISPPGPVLAADHYAYVALMGSAPAIATGALLWWRGLRWRAWTLLAAFVLLAGALLAPTRRQIATWRNTYTLFAHALGLDPDAYAAHVNLGVAYLSDREPEKAVREFEAQLDRHPEDVLAHLYIQRVRPNLKNYQRPPGREEIERGSALLDAGKLPQAEAAFKAAIRKNPRLPEAHMDLAQVYFQEDRVAQSVIEYRRATQLDPVDPIAWNNLGTALLRNGQIDEAIDAFRRSLSIDRTSARAQENLRFAGELKQRLQR